MHTIYIQHVFVYRRYVPGTDGFPTDVFTHLFIFLYTSLALSAHMTEAQASATKPADWRNFVGRGPQPPTQNHPQAAQKRATPPDAARRRPPTLAVGPTSSDVAGYQANIHQ